MVIKARENDSPVTNLCSHRDLLDKLMQDGEYEPL